MLQDYELFIERSVHEQLKALRGVRRRAILEFLDGLAATPIFEGGLQFEEADGRWLQKVSVSGLVIVFHVDHALSEVKVVSLRAWD